MLHDDIRDDACQFCSHLAYLLPLHLMTLYDKGSDYLTFTTTTTPREHEFAFATYSLQSGRSYEI